MVSQQKVWTHFLKFLSNVANEKQLLHNLCDGADVPEAQEIITSFSDLSPTLSITSNSYIHLLF